MNAYLASPEGRTEFGRETDIVKFMKKWSFIGVQQTDLKESTNGRDMSALMTVQMWYRARVWDLHLATGEAAPPFAHLWFVLRREPYVHPLLHRRNNARIPAPEHKWVIRPYIVHDRTRPPLSVYMGKDWVGHCIFVGMVASRFDNVRPPQKAAPAAAEALVATDLQEAKSRFIRHLPEMEVNLFIH
jgi:hypothetical protein